MSKFDIEAAIARIEKAWNSERPDSALHFQLREEFRAAVLAGREEIVQLAENLGNDPMNRVDKESADLIAMNARNKRIMRDP